MPDLQNDLSDLLRERAAHAPAVPAPTEALAARVRRRRATRLSLAVAGSAAGVAAVAVVAASAFAPQAARVPESPAASVPASGACEGEPAAELDVTAHPTELRYERDCYVVAAGTTTLRFTNRNTALVHNVAIIAGDDISKAGQPGRPFLGVSDIVEGDRATSKTVPPLEPGRYLLFCQVHPLITARLEVR